MIRDRSKLFPRITRQELMLLQCAQHRQDREDHQ